MDKKNQPEYYELNPVNEYRFIWRHSNNSNKGSY